MTIDHLRGSRRALTLLAITALAPSRGSAQAPVTVRVENPLTIARADETVSLAWSALQAKLPGLVATRVRVRDLGSGREIPSQVIDTDANGAPDALLFQVDVRARDARLYAVEPSAAATFAPRTFVRHDEPRDDIAWESDRLAWRVYGEGLKKTTSAMSSSGVDIWVKKTRGLVVQKWYDKGTMNTMSIPAKAPTFTTLVQRSAPAERRSGSMTRSIAQTTSLPGKCWPRVRFAPSLNSSIRSGRLARLRCRRPSASALMRGRICTAKRVCFTVPARHRRFRM